MLGFLELQKSWRYSYLFYVPESLWGSMWKSLTDSHEPLVLTSMKVVPKSYLGMERKIKIQPKTTYQFLQVFNGILELTDKELDVLSRFIDMSETINLCSAETKRSVAESMGIDNPNTLNIYVKRLKDKGAIKKTKNGYKVSKLLERNPKVIIEIT